MASSLKARKTELLNDDAEIDGFISYLGGLGQKPFEDQDAIDKEQPKKAAANRLSLAGDVCAEALAEETSFLALHPRVQNAILKGEQISKMPPTRKSSWAIQLRPKRKTRDALKRKKAEWRQAVKELGLEEAKRRHGVPAIESKRRAKDLRRRKDGLRLRRRKRRKGINAEKTRRRQRTKNTQRKQAAASFFASLKELQDRIDAYVAKPGKAAEETLAEKGYELMDI